MCPVKEKSINLNINKNDFLNLLLQENNWIIFIHSKILIIRQSLNGYYGG